MTLTTTHPRGHSGPVAPPAEPGAGSEEAIASWRAWRATRSAELRRPHGWLSLAGFAWLTPDAIDVALRMTPRSTRFHAGRLLNGVELMTLPYPAARQIAMRRMSPG